MSYNNGNALINAAVRLPYLVKQGLLALADRFTIDDAYPNNWRWYADNAAATGKVHYMIAVDPNNQTYFNNPNGVKAFALEIVALTTPAVPTITNGGTPGSTTYTYKVVAISGTGASLGTTAASAAGSSTTGNATLSATNFEIITFTAVTGAASYDIYRTVGGSTQGKIANVPATISQSTGVQSATYVTNDTGLTADGTTAPTVNTTAPLASLNITTLTTPVNVVVTPVGTAGATSYSYKVVAKSTTGASTAASSAGSTTTGNATLTTANLNRVTWNPVPGAASYDVYRTVGGAAQGKIGNVVASASPLKLDDTGLTGDTTTAPTINNTGGLTVGQLVKNATDQAITGSTTIAAANLINGVLRVTSGTDTSTTDTAAAIVAAIPNCQVGSSFELSVFNGSGATHTIGLGTGVTAAAGFTSTLTTANGSAHRFLFIVTNVGTPAVSIYSYGSATS